MPRREIENLGDPNLVPIMAIMCILIPILLFSFVFYDVKVQDISLPKFKGGSGSGSDVQVLSLMVFVAKDTLTVREQQSDGKIVSEVVLQRVSYKNCSNKATPCNECEGAETKIHDFAGLYNAVRKIKAKPEFAAQESISIGAEDGVPWRIIARVIDAVRSQLDKETYGVEGAETTNPMCYYDRAIIKRDKNIVVPVDADEVDVAAATDEAKQGDAPPVPMFPKIVFVF